MRYFILSLLIQQSPLLAEHFISFIVPCYNCERWIRDTLESIYAQNLDCPFEIVCTDDGSTDRTYEILCSFVNQPEIHIIQHSHNRGGAAARNTCIENSRGDLIFCLDSDNLLMPNSVQQLINHLDMTGSDIVSFGGLHCFSDHFQPQGDVTYNRPNLEYTFLDIIQDDQTPPWSGNYLYTRDSFDRAGGYVDCSAADTFAFGFLQLLSGSKMTYVPNTFYWHRVNNDGYYTREARYKRLQISFFRFLLSHQDLFDPNSIAQVERHLRLALNNRDFYDQIWFLHNKIIRLKE